MAFDARDHYWNDVSGSDEADRKSQALVRGKVASAPYWPHLSRALDETDFSNRLSVVAGRLEAAIDPEVYPEVVASLWDDYRAVKTASESDEPLKSASSSVAEENYGYIRHPFHHLYESGYEGGVRGYAPDRGLNHPAYAQGYDHGSRDRVDYQSGAYSPEQWGRTRETLELDPHGRHSAAKDGMSDDDHCTAYHEWATRAGHNPDDLSTLKIYEKNVPGIGRSRADKIADVYHGEDTDWRQRKQATNYQPDPNAAWRYHQPYEQLRQPVNNGDLQDSDGFPVDLAQDEHRDEERMQFQLTPGQWHDTPGTAMPERPMPFSQERGYQPVASVDNDGFLVDSSVRHTAPGGGEHAPYRIKEEGGRYYVENDKGERKEEKGYSSREEARQHQKALYANVPGAAESAAKDEKKTSASLRVDSDGFLVQASDVAEEGVGGRANSPLVDPAPGASQRVNPFYFQTEDAAMGSNEGFPEQPTPDPQDRVNEIYGETQPQSSPGSTEGTSDGKGYSRSHPGESPNFSSRAGRSNSWDPDEIRDDESKHNEDRLCSCRYDPHSESVKVDPNCDLHGHFARQGMRVAGAQNEPEAKNPPVGWFPRNWSDWRNTPHLDPYGEDLIAPDVRDPGYSKSIDNRQKTAASTQYKHDFEDDTDLANHQQRGRYDARNGRNYAGEEHQDDPRARAYRQGWDSAHTAVGYGTDGKIIGNCPGCDKPLRKHYTAHGEEKRHLHNDHVRCFGDRTAKRKAVSSYADTHRDLGPPGRKMRAKDWTDEELERAHRDAEQEEEAERRAMEHESMVDSPGSAVGADDDKDLAVDPADDDMDRTAVYFTPHEAVVPNGANFDNLAAPMTFQEALDYNSGYGTHVTSDLSSGSVHTADYLGRPDANNPTGRGPDEYRAERWDAYRTTRPMQTADQRRINTPVLPERPLRTGPNANTPTPGLKGSDEANNPDEDDDEEE